MAQTDKEFNGLNKVGNKNGISHFFVILFEWLFIITLGILIFFLIREASDIHKIVLENNVLGETETTIVGKMGEEVTLTAKKISGYRFICWNVDDETVSKSPAYTIKVNDYTPQKYTAVYEREYQITIENPIESRAVVVNKSAALEGEEVTITISPNNFYTLTQLQCLQGETEIELINNKFIMPAGDVTIITDFDKTDFAVLYPHEQIGYSIKNIDDTDFDITTTKANTEISFKVEIDEEYTQSKLVVRNNNRILKDIEGVYTISNITSNVNLSFEGVRKNTYKVTLPKQVGYKLLNLDNTDLVVKNVEYGTTLSFKIEIGEAYTQSENNFTILCNDVELISENGVYSIPNITENINLTIDGIVKNIYTIQVPEIQDFYELKNDKNTEEFAVTSIEYGKSLKFRVSVDASCSQSVIVVKNNDEILTPKWGVYTISNVNDNVNITVDGIEKNVYTIAYPEEQIGYTLQNIDGTDFDVNNVEYGETLTFKVDIDAAYSKSIVVVKKNGTVLTAEDGVYTIPNISKNTTITINGLKINTYSITYPTKQVGYVLQNLDETSFKTKSVKYGDALTFKLVVDTGYVNSIGNLSVKCNDTELTLNDDVYTIPNITENLILEVDGLEVNSYTITFPTEVTVKRNGEELTTGDTIYHYDILTLYSSPEEGYKPVYMVTSANRLTNPNQYQVVGNVTIEYTTEVGVRNANEYPTLKFQNYDDENFTVQVGANTSNKPTGDVLIPSRVEKNDIIYSVTIMYRNSFQNCTDITSITIANSIKEIWRNSFDGCTGLQSVTFVENSELTFINNDVFKNCYNLTSIELPKTITSMGSGVFNGCSRLENLTIPFIGSSLEMSESTRLYPLGYIFGSSAYDYSIQITQTYYDSGWKKSKEYSFPVSLKSLTICGGEVCKYALENLSMLQSVVLLDGVTNIKNNAFYRCSRLASVTIPSSVESIEDGVFFGCCSLTNIEFPVNSQLTQIGNSAFAICTKLTSIVIPNNVTSIGIQAFYECTNLTSITIPSSVTSIGAHAFQYCDNLAQIIIESANIYNEVTACDNITDLLVNATTVKVLASVVDDVNNANAYLNDTSNFTKSEKTEIDGKEYYIYTKA